jgi:5-methylcytosine-specific restriction protein A
MSFCSAPGCVVKVVRGYCNQHARQVEQRRGSQRERGYTRQWEQRARWFRQRYALCGQRPGGLPPVMSRCHDEGRITVAAQVDHVIPHRGDERLFWDEQGNWQSLCASCGARKSAAGL